VRRGNGLKYSTIVIALVGSALALSASTQTWYTFRLAASSGHSGPIAVSGSSSAPAISALSVAGVAFAAALALAGPVLRYVLSALGLALAAGIIGSTASALGDPVGSGIAVVTQGTGIAGAASVRAIVVGTDATIWPTLALVGGILLALSAAVVIATSHRWPRASRRYGATRAVSEDDTAASASVDQSVSAADAKARAREAAIDDWDELSRGDDPTIGEPDEDDGRTIDGRPTIDDATSAGDDGDASSVR
jgi:hypothetical protein